MQSRTLVLSLLILTVLVANANAYCLLGKYTDKNGNCQDCPQNCQVCKVDDDNSVDCYACNEGFRVNMKTMACQACPANCKQCTSKDGKCTECVENYLYNQDSDKCEIQKRDSNGVVICIKGYYNDEGICNICGAFCTECDNYGTCTSCQDGFFLTTDEEYFVSRIECELCHFPCKTCNSDGKCLTEYDTPGDLYQKVSGKGKCSTGEFQSTQDGSCQSCGFGCTDCNKYGVCLDCSSGYKLVNGSGSYAFPYCDACGPADSCAQDGIDAAENKCGVSYFYSESADKCMACGYGCKHCTQEGFCVECNSGLYLSSNYMYCNNQPYKSANCAIGTYEELTGICTKCKQGCYKCREWNICESCKSGFHLVGSDNTCVNITEYEAGQQVVKCNVRYYQKGKTCEYCGDGCLICNENLGCMACDNGWNLKNGVCSNTTTPSNQTTTLCAAHCLSCSAPFTCDVCQDGFYHYNGGCLACSYGCQTCTNGFSCSDGQEEQEEEQQGGQYDITCSYNCISCSSSNQCSACRSGHQLYNGGCVAECKVGTYRETSNGACYSCNSNCLECTAWNVCQKCASGYSFSYTTKICEKDQVVINCLTGTYYNSNNGRCEECSQGCYDCLNSAQCLTCSSGYALSYGSCVLQSCPPGTYRSGSSCINCDSQCLECSNGGQCSTCSDGYYLKNSECNHCGADCRTCDINEKCTNVNSYDTSCPVGQFRNSFNMCFNCPFGCERCGEMYTCITCKSGYYKNSLGTCSQCIGCSTCSAGGVCQGSSSSTSGSDYSTVVSSCGHGRYMSAYGYCMNCGYGCDYCDQTGTCKRCYSGYYSMYNFCYKCNYPCATCSSGSQCLTTLSSLDWAEQNPNAHLALIILGVSVMAVGVAYLAYWACHKNSKQGSPALLEEHGMQMTSTSNVQA